MVKKLKRIRATGRNMFNYQFIYAHISVPNESTSFFLPYLIVPFTEELELLCLLVHEYSIQMTRLNWSNFDRFVAPAHDLTRRDVRWKGNRYCDCPTVLPSIDTTVLTDTTGHFSPLHAHALLLFAIRRHVHTLQCIEIKYTTMFDMWNPRMPCCGHWSMTLKFKSFYHRTKW